ncbi:AbrB/MazE/SpoVT family DNA-binding domain-containing protein [Agilicoccus flavus]|uniref:AbrB/MazE/SpoVT family DNA-binding domain-containing protein n=1 Tax=Agilicoccus flavus TaxID=2775968 RepID=UPI001CF6CBA7|nr:AbrB/MazE/SpoVT family DNA-binding domain-containing protein [Agilicoccus flavus]
MQTTIDAAGRIVVPKSMREDMGLGPGQLVDIALTDGRLEIEVPPMAASVETRGGLPIIRPVDAPGAALDDDTVRATIEATRR